MPSRVLTGSDVVLVTGIQARNNARILFVGSLYLLSNEAFADATTANKYFSNAITRWTFQESGVLRATVRGVTRSVHTDVVSPLLCVCLCVCACACVRVCFVCAFVCLCVRVFVFV